MNLSIYRRYDWGIFAVAISLMVFGILAIYSIDLSRAAHGFLNYQKQIIFAALGSIILLAAPLFNWRVVQYQSRLIYLIGLVLLVLVLFFGDTRHGATGWFNLGIVSLQPAELAKLALIIALAKYLSNQGYIPDWRIAGEGMTLVVFYLLPLLAQPDLGGASILAAVGVGMLLMMRLPKRILIIMATIMIALGTIGWLGVLKPYQKDRILTFLDPARDPRGRGYNITQSIVAVGAGGVFGKGLGAGSQGQLHFLPEAHTDFIFAVISEELGFVAGVTIIACYAFLLYRLHRIAKSTRDNFALFVIAGTQILIAVQMIVNIGMNIGLLPVTGLPLPLISYGGSSMIATTAAIGLIESMKVHMV